MVFPILYVKGSRMVLHVFPTHYLLVNVQLRQKAAQPKLPFHQQARPSQLPHNEAVFKYIIQTLLQCLKKASSLLAFFTLQIEYPLQPGCFEQD